jgi:uncharacterized protein with PIN domain
LGIIAAGRVHAAEGPEEVLKKHGLKRAGSLYVLEQEAVVRSKLGEAQSALNNYAASVRNRWAIEFSAARAQKLENDIIELDYEIGALNLELERTPAHPNNVERDYYESVRIERDARRNDRNEAVADLRRIRNQATGERARPDLEAQIQRRHQTCIPIVQELLELVDSTDAKYAELANNRQVRDAFAEFGRTAKAGLKVGPSPQYGTMVKQTRTL